MIRPKKAKEPGTTNDHVVPVMYLNRFGVPKAGGNQIQGAPADNMRAEFTNNVRRVATEKGFYWGIDDDGVPHHLIEAALEKIETASAFAFRAILDKGSLPSDMALPNRWPAAAEHRIQMAWWLAAQILRTARQRQRLWRMSGEGLDLPRGLSRANNGHLQYIEEGIAPLAGILSRRPWGIGVTTACLLTSDVPVQIINAQDDDDQHLAASFWDIYVPLDPHRFLYLPGELHEGQGDLLRDHLFTLPGNMAEPLNMLMVESAHRHVFWHPEHDPRKDLDVDSAAAMRAASGHGFGSQTLMAYEAIPYGYNVERRILEHCQLNTVPEQGEAASPPPGFENILPHMERMLDEADRRYSSLRGVR